MPLPFAMQMRAMRQNTAIRSMQSMGCAQEDIQRVLRYLQDGGTCDTIPRMLEESRKPRPRPWVTSRVMFPRQQHVFDWYAQPHTLYKGLLLAWPVGKGKTVGAMAAYCGARHQHPREMSLIVSCPKSVVSMWKTELQTAERLYGLYIPDNYFVCTHDHLVNHVYARRDTLSDTFLIVDEADTFRTRISKRMVNASPTLEEERRGVVSVGDGPKPNNAYKMLRVASRCPSAVMVTASDRRNSLDDLNNLVSVLTRRSEPYAKKEWTRMMTDPQILACVYRLVPCEDPHYPRVDHSTSWTLLRDHTLMHYLQVMALFKPEQYERPEIFLTGLRNAQQEHLDSLAGGMHRVISMTRDLVGRREKVMICTQFTFKVLRVLSALLRDIPHVMIDGTVSEQERPVLVQRFNQPTFDVPVALLSSAAGAGINFNRSRCRRVIIYGSSWNEEMDVQWVGRVRRMHALDHLPVEERVIKVTSVYMKMPETIEEYENVLHHVQQHHPRHIGKLRVWAVAETKGLDCREMRAEVCQLLGEEVAKSYLVAAVITSLWKPNTKSADELMHKIQTEKAVMLGEAKAREAEIVMTFDPKA